MPYYITKGTPLLELINSYYHLLVVIKIYGGLFGHVNYYPYLCIVYGNTDDGFDLQVLGVAEGRLQPAYNNI